MNRRHGVLALLISLFAITYLDRVCISVAGPSMQRELGIDAIGWGWVTGIFTLAYCVFEIPTGTMGDRLGARRVLTRIVLWWSAFTSITGMVSNFYLLLAARFAFGAGEAGVFPNSVIVISRWFPASQRATISGVTLMAAQVGGAAAPLLVVPIQAHYGWRASFFIFGALGLVWAAIWYAWFRDSPAASSSTPAAPAPSHVRIPWSAVFRSSTAWAMMITAFGYATAYNFFQTWLHTFLVKGRGFTDANLALSSIPYFAAIATTLLGGFASDFLVRRLGVKWGRRSLGIFGLACAGASTLALTFTHHQLLTIAFLALIYGSITFQQAGMFGATLDIGHRYAGALTGLMNTAAQVGGLFSTVAFGYVVSYFQSYDAPFYPIAALLFLGAFLWFKIDASRPL